MTSFLDLESPLDPVPTFHVDAPDGRRTWPEIDRQAMFFGLMRIAAPTVMLEANANAGKRNPRKARKEGIKAGVFDVSVRGIFPHAAWIEFKGYDARGKAGKLTDAQIEWGNRMTERGWPVACFFSPFAATEWLRAKGFAVSAIKERGW